MTDDQMREAVIRYVLIVEDDPTMRDALETMLRSEGYATVGVGSANEALTHLTASARPALILLDLELPDIQGDAFYSTIRADPAFATVPVIVLTGQTDPPSLPGVFATILKVEPPDAIMGRIDAACRSHDSGAAG